MNPTPSSKNDAAKPQRVDIEINGVGYRWPQRPVVVVPSDDVCIGGSAAAQDLSGLQGHRLRTHGGLSEAKVPLVLNRPLNVAYRANAAGEVLLRARMCTICRSDLDSYQGQRPNPTPGVLGHEIIGSIVALGQGMVADMRGEPLRGGDRVTRASFSSPATTGSARCWTCRTSHRASRSTGTCRPPPRRATTAASASTATSCPRTWWRRWARRSARSACCPAD